MTNKPLMERFFDKVSPEPMSGCWLWTGSTRTGYGLFRADGRTQSAHRLSLLWFKGIDAGKLDVCHKCDTPACINPDHLFAGTEKDNMADRDRKGRGSFPGNPGEKNGHARLTDEAVIEIRKMRAAGDYYHVIAKRFNVGTMTAYNAATGKSWQHLT